MIVMTANSSHMGRTYPIVVSGILPKEERKVNTLNDNIIMGRLDNLNKQRFGIVLGAGIAMKLGLSMGDKVINIRLFFSNDHH